MDWVETNGVVLRYELSGTGHMPLLLIHELGGSLEFSDPVISAFQQDFQVLRYDLRGFGMSEKVKVLRLDRPPGRYRRSLGCSRYHRPVSCGRPGTRRGHRAGLCGQIPQPRAPPGGQQSGDGCAAGATRAVTATCRSGRARWHAHIRRAEPGTVLPGALSGRPPALRAVSTTLADERSRGVCRHQPHANRDGPHAAICSNSALGHLW